MDLGRAEDLASYIDDARSIAALIRANAASSPVITPARFEDEGAARAKKIRLVKSVWGWVWLILILSWAIPLAVTILQRL